MAAKETINIDIQTAANTAGIDKAGDAVKKLNGTVNLASGQAPGGLKNLGNVANQVGFQVTDFAIQVQAGQSAMVALSQQLPQAIGAMQQLGGATGGLSNVLSSAVSGGTAFSLIATELAIGGKLAADAYQQMTAALRAADNAIQNFRNSMVSSGEQLRSLDASARSLEVAEAFREGTEEAKKFNAELERSNRLRQAQDALAETSARLGGAGAGELAALAAQRQANQLAAELAAAEARKAQAQEAFLAQTSVVNQARAPGQSAADLAAAEVRLRELEQQVATTTAEVVNLAAVNAVKLQEVGLNATQSVTDAAEAAFTKTGEDLRAQLQQIQATEGAQTSAAVTQALKDVSQILADGKVAADEVGKLGSVLALYRQSAEANTRETQAQINALITLTGQQAAGLEASRRSIEALTARISTTPQD